MLVIVHDGDVHLFAQLGFNFKTLGCFDVFEINAAKSGFKRFYNFNEGIGIFFINFDIKTINACIFLNNTALPSITGLAASGPIFPKPSTAVPFDITATKFPLLVYL